MKSNLLKYVQITSFLVALLFSISSNAQENDASNYNLSFEFKTVKQEDNTRLLKVDFTGKNKEDRKDILPIYGAEIKFFNVLNEEEVLLGSSKTSKEGTAQIIISENQNYLTDENGNINLMAKFEGSDAMEEMTSEIVVKNIHLELTLEVIDSLKTVMVNAFTIDKSGAQIPVEEADIVFYVNGMLSKMKINEGTISEGAYEFEFPTDLPGNKNGDLIVYSIIEDNEEFGTVIQEKAINWGVFQKETKKIDNTLWSSAGPIWMYIVLTILLVGVWANYVYTIINLFKIRKEGTDLELKTEIFKG
jgi:hypothetical protein